ncbi:MAG: rod shape-determining protein MreC, partial [Patescibacteria group bacterium]
VFLYKMNLLAPVNRGVHAVVAPIATGATATRNFLEKWFRWIGTPSRLAEENSRLAYELARITMDAAKLKALEQENIILKKELDFKEKSERQTVLAKVIGKNNLDDSEALILDKGKSDGILLGEAVVYADGVIVGKIAKVYDDYSLVLLMTDAKASLAATILNTGRTTGLVRGEHGLAIKMNLIPQEEKIARGDIIITSGLEPEIPRNLVIGVVESVTKEVREPFQTALIRSPADLNNLDYLMVVAE